MAHKKGAGSNKNGRDSNSKRLGVKFYANTVVKAEAVIIRQRGLTFKQDLGVSVGEGYTIFATQEGFVHFDTEKKTKIVNVCDSTYKHRLIKKKSLVSTRLFFFVNV
tara:strand:- start:302 stop:622 length:321 start_codon:yes stop_codon:yes gene_type:complete